MDFEDYKLPNSEQLNFNNCRPIRAYKKQVQKGPFIKGPIPVNWLQQAMKYGFAALSVGVFLWYFHGLNKPKTFEVSIKKVADLMGSNWQKARRGLLTLEKAKLITIEKRPGRKHKIKINDGYDPSSS